MTINILSAHRFHLLDLARELSRLGHDVQYYSYVPTRRCVQFGIDATCCSCFLWLVWPFFALEKLLPVSLRQQVVWYRNLWMDWYLSHAMRRCEVLIALGYDYKLSVVTARKKWGALTILEWGSKHIIEQLKCLDREDCYLPKQLRRDLEAYEVCDYISVPATHAYNSFRKHGIAPERLLLNPYGVDLSQFHPTICTHAYDLLFVGGWRREKGCDLITELCREYGYRFLHVGALLMDFPDLPNMTHVDAVDQRKLIDYYAQAKVFVLPSRAEGLAMVQAQAIACGLPVVCSKETGGVDLRNMFADKQWIIEMEELSVDALHVCVEQALRLADSQQDLRQYARESLAELTWAAYGRRYDNLLKQIVR